MRERSDSQETLGSPETRAPEGQPTPQALAPDVAALRLHQTAWARVPVFRRLQILRRFRKRLLLDIPGMLALIPDHTPIDVMMAEILPMISAIRFLEKEAASLLKDAPLSILGRPIWLWGVKSHISRRPLGVVLIIAPGNYPLMLAGIQTLQALTAGNTVALKPAPGRTALLNHFVALLTQAGLPQGVIHILPEDAGPKAVQEAFDLVVLTGSEETGKKVALAAAQNLTPTIMELSGADPVFVLPSANLSLVARALHFGLTLKHGSTCIAPRRVFVHGNHREALGAQLALLLKNSGTNHQKHYPALDQLTLTVEQAGGSVRKLGAATILLLDADQAELADVDLFAPWLALIGVSDMAEAIEIESRSRHALGASIFGEEKEARALAKQIPAGSVTINDLIAPTADPRLPFGGARASGYGMTRGREGLLSITRAVSVSTRRSGAFHLLHYARILHGKFSR
ncbi:aldehyde dehydrogenase family protein [Asaia spathodeae]|uniref:aldehyde dehydrogenase family protein n=1 Tax=Asaia spathodeae TaxID=657016 RepID=UPI002FC2E6EA